MGSVNSHTMIETAVQVNQKSQFGLIQVRFSIRTPTALPGSLDRYEFKVMQQQHVKQGHTWYGVLYD